MILVDGVSFVSFSLKPKIVVPVKDFTVSANASTLSFPTASTGYS